MPPRDVALVVQGARSGADEPGMHLLGMAIAGLTVFTAVGCQRQPTLDEALVMAAEAQNLARLGELLDAGAHPDATRLRPWPVGGRAGPALRLAAAAGNDAMVRLLLDRGADLGQAEALQFAAVHGHRDTVRLLVLRGADPARTDASGRTAFLAALAAGQVAIATELAAPERDGVLGALLQGDTAAVVAAAATDMDAPGIPGVTLLHVAARAGRTEIVDALLGLGAPRDAACAAGSAWLGSPLVLAVREGHAATVRLLLDRGTDPHQVTARRSALVLAAGQGHAAVVRLLVERGARVDEASDVQPPLCAAAVEGRVLAIAALLDLGAQIDRPNQGGRAPLRLAAGQAHTAAVELLIARGATIDPHLATELRGLRFPPAAPATMEHIVRLIERRRR